MDVHQSLAGDQTKPNENGPGRIDQEMVNALSGRQPGFLQNVVGVDSTMKPRVHAKRHEPPESIAMLRKQFSQRILISVGDSSDEFRISSIVCHNGFPNPSSDLFGSFLRHSSKGITTVKRTSRRLCGNDDRTIREPWRRLSARLLEQNYQKVAATDPSEHVLADRFHEKYAGVSSRIAHLERKKGSPALSFRGMLFERNGLLDFLCSMPDFPVELLK